MHLRFELLGHFRVVVDGRAVSSTEWRRTRSAALLKLLALSAGNRLHREQTMDTLWPELAPEAAAANLRKAVHYARRALGSGEVLRLQGEMLALAPDADIDVDATIFENEARAALRAGDAVACQRAAQQYAGELLPDDQYADWSEEPRQRLSQLYLRLLKVGCLWEQLIEVDPTDEEAQRNLMQAALDAGNRGEVVRLFRRLRERLRVDLGLSPSPATIALYERALTPAGEEPASPAERIGGLLAWGIVAVGNGDFGKADRLAREARTLALEAGLAREMGEASALVGLVAHMQGQWLDLFRSEFVTWIVDAPQYSSNVFDGHLCLAEFCLCGAGGHDAIARAAGELLTIAENAESVHGRALATLILGEAELFSGRFDTAEKLLGQSAQLHLQAGAVAGRAMALQRLVEVALARGQKWQADRLLHKARKVADASWLVPHLGITLQGLAVEVASSSPQAIEAVAHGDRLIATGRTCRPCSMGFRVASAMLLAEVGELDAASRRLEEAERVAGLWQGGPWVAAVWEARGVLRQAQGRPAQAAALFGEAAARFAELGRPAAQARCDARAAALR